MLNKVSKQRQTATISLLNNGIIQMADIGRRLCVWLDDERPMPPGFDLHIKIARHAIELLRAGLVLKISLDHDLGPEAAGSGYQVACAIEELAMSGELSPLEVTIHSANPVGRERMGQAINNARRYWAELDTIANDKSAEE